MPGGIQPGQIIAGAAVVVAAVLILLLWPGGTAAPEQTLPRASDQSQVPAVALTDPEVVVHISGAVASPGVYRLEPGLRLIDLVEAAGGPNVDAVLDRLNLAAVVHDGDRIHVPSSAEDTSQSGALTVTPTSSGPVNINGADASQLETLPGIGPSLAAAIVEDRDRLGPFGSVDDLERVSGIGPAKLDGIRDLVGV
ncbi:MAG: ComEA family DNA-binding protein [Actinomycetia bacterium]|nr:ComEA family DNA-binding protein [Actinomycetes bacterium]